MKRIAVFCGSAPGQNPEYLSHAAKLGTLIAKNGFGLVYGGATYGTMGAVADAALEAGGEVIGVIPQHFAGSEAPHHGLTQLQVVPDMHQRKARMAELADGFVALPGGAGTLEELFEVWTWAHLGIHDKPIGLLDVAGYYSLLLRFVDHMVNEGFLHHESRDRVFVESDPVALLDKLAADQISLTHPMAAATVSLASHHS
ncbi:TIGR00730 family Rossman fold protein [Streptomyces sp. NPDC057717]|uniref:LOG family protein n=1 Tax=Streptomyces sp. NPDC057717 TaxID=3346224 RepID=UPI0036953549